MDRKVFSHGNEHVYEDRAARLRVFIPQGSWALVPEEAAAVILGAHPGKLCDVTSLADPSLHRCKLTPLDDQAAKAREEQKAADALRLDLQPQTKMTVSAKLKARSLRYRMMGRV